ncbi:DUF4136 domain-containing protein [Pontibacter sp. MBLB2868]|uniref:DUF4136 domain-containing protein n=1 Tax=Pontibacter sp. MBLB2868 TaxID=3451555 RepID=UPI003F754D01
MKKSFNVLYLFLLVLLCAACSPVIHTSSESVDNFKLSDYKTFAFYETDASRTGIGYSTQLNYIENEIARQLEQRGLSRTSTDPDLLVNLGIVVKDTTQTRETNILTDPPFYIGQRRYTWKSHEVVVRRYKEGTISVDLVANDKNELVWQGVAEGAMEEKTEKVQEQIRKGMEKLFSELDK